MFAIKAAKNSRRPLGEIHHRIEQRFVFAPACSRNRARCGVESFANLLVALFPIKDFRRAQRLGVNIARPPNSSGITVSSSMATSQRTGRTNLSLVLRQYIFFGQ